MAKIDKSKMKCNKPKRQISGGKKSVVKACDKGKEKIVVLGMPTCPLRRTIPNVASPSAQDMVVIKVLLTN